MRAPLQEALFKLDASDILLWHRILEEYMELSHKEKLWGAAIVMMKGCSDDGFDYFRGWLAAQGKGMEGILAKKKRLDALQPEAGMLGTVKGITLEDAQDLKKTALEYYVLTDKMKDLSVKYVKLKSKVPTETEKLETAKKLGEIRQLEKDKARLEAVLKAYGIDPNSQKPERTKEAK